MFVGAAALLVSTCLLVGRSRSQDKPAADAAAADSAEDELPVMIREYQEVRETKDKDGVMVPIELDRRARTAMTRILNEGKFSQPEDEAIFDGYYTFRIAELTWKENLTDLPNKRLKFKNGDLMPSGRAEDQTVHAKLNSKLVTVLPNIALSDAYHPTVRYNCMLIVASLDQVEPVFNGPPALPLPESLNALMKAAGDEKQIDAVRIAALDGLVRHCGVEVAKPARGDLVEMLMKIVKAKKPSPVGKPGGQLWLRYRAAQALGLMAAKWPEANRPETVDALQQLVTDEDAPFIFRAEAANSLGSMDKGVFNNANMVRDLSAVVGQLAIIIASKAPLPDAGKVNSENLTYCLMRTNSALKGLDQARGLAAAATEPGTKKFVMDLAGKIDGLVSTANDSRLNDSDRTGRLKDEADRLGQWLQKSRTSLAKMN